MTIIDPPIKDNSYFYKYNSNFQLEKTNESNKTISQNDDVYSLKNVFSNRKKWFILSIVTLQGFLGPLTSSIYVPAIVQVRQTLDASYTAINATISLYVFVMGVAPLLWASLSELNGRRAIYILSTFIYVMSTIGCALANTVTVFIALRAFQAVGASAAQAVGAGTITDLFDVQERGNAMGLFLLGALIGPVLGPIAGGFINQFWDWRCIFWCLTGLGGVTFLLILFYLPETSTIILKKRAEYNNKSMSDELWSEHDEKFALSHHIEKERRAGQKTVLLPLKFLLNPVIVLITTPYSIAYGFMYFVIASLPNELTLHYHFSSYQIGLAYLANGIGNALGAYVSGVLSDKSLNKHRLASKEDDDKLDFLEYRLIPMWIGIILLPFGILLYGWSVQYEVNVAFGLAGLFLLGFGVGIVQTPANTYVVDAYQKYSASAMSTANLLRCVSAGCTPLIAPTLIGRIGNGWSTTILAIISGMSGFCILLVQRYGKKWREQTKIKL